MGVTVTDIDSGWRFSHTGSAIEGFCEHPQIMVNTHSGEWYSSRCGSARSSKCGPCSEVKKGDIAAIGRSGWLDRPRDRGFFLTLTAPGADVLPWDVSKCNHSAGVECSGKIGCRVEVIALGRWHDTLGQRWSWLMTDLRRVLKVDVQFLKTWEPQDRGALHAHVMVRVNGPVTERRMRAAVRLVSQRWGFGRQYKCDLVDLSSSDLEAVQQVLRTAGYCAKYSAKSADALPSVVRVDGYTGEMRHGGMRAWSASAEWGDRMRDIHARRREWAVMCATEARAGGRGSDPGCAGGAAGADLDSNQDCYASAPIIQPAAESDQLL